MRGIKYILLFFVAYACRKDVTPKLPKYQQKIVIDASIETGSPAIAFLSLSVPYFNTFDFTTPENAFVKGATVVVSDGSVSDTLKEIDPKNGFLYVGFKLVGKQGKTYTIRVSYGGKTFETSTSILNPPKIDSLYFKTVERDSLGFMWQKFSEPVGSGDAYRWFAKRLGRDNFYAAPFNSVFNDKFVDGKTFEFGYDRGPQPNQLQQNREDPERGFYKRGDTVVVKFCKIGSREYSFWETYYQNKASNGNPFSAPTNIKNMFEKYEDAFGAFVGYSPVFDTLVIPRK